MLIILGAFVLADGVNRDEFMDKRVGALAKWRQDSGCIEYTIGADAMDQSRVLLVEIWDSVESLEAHMDQMAGTRVSTVGGDVVTFDSMHFEISDVREVNIPARFAPRSDKPGWWNGTLIPA